MEVSVSGPVSDDSLYFVVQPPSEMIHSPSSLLDQRKDSVVWTHVLETDIVAIICLVVPEFRIAGYEKLGSRREVENRLNGFRKALGKLLTVDIFTDFLHCLITVVGAIVPNEPATA